MEQPCIGEALAVSGRQMSLQRLLLLLPLLLLHLLLLLLQLDPSSGVPLPLPVPVAGVATPGAAAGGGAGSGTLSGTPSPSRFLAQTPPDVLEDASLSVPKLLRKYGYPVENHVVMTEDGYVLTLHRIPHGVGVGAGASKSKTKSKTDHGDDDPVPDPLTESGDTLNDISSNRVRSIRDTISDDTSASTSRRRSSSRGRSANASARRFHNYAYLAGPGPELRDKRKRGAADGRDKDREGAPIGKAVLLLPGMMCSSAVFLVMGPNHGLGYILADSGYDVWIANPRGVRYSMGHVEIPPTDDKYWQFSWHEMGQYDVPAILDYMTATTGQAKVPVVGHSMGSTMMMVMGAVRPEYNKKVAVHVALAPTAYLQHAQSPVLKGLAPLVPTVSTLTDMLGMHGIRPTPPLNEALKQMCRDEAVVTQRFCKNSAFMLLGFDPEQLNATMFPVIMGHFPSGGSTRILLHYMQGFSKGDFREYDMGSKKNLLRYGQFTPPAYNLSKVDFPTALFAGENDWVDSMEDVEQLAKELPNVVDFYRVPWPKFNHMDHVFAIDAKTLEYDHLMDVLKRFS